jgi:hypothetical protein
MWPGDGGPHEGHASDKDAPIFVIGYQRSGTTLIQALLGAHPRIAAPPETYFVSRVADQAEYLGDLGDDANLSRALHEALNPPVDIFAECGFDHDRLLARAMQGPRTYAALFDTIMSDFAARAGKQRWSEKSAGQPIDAPYGLFPDAQVVHIVRDPRDVVASSLHAPGLEPDATGIARGWRSFTVRAIRRGFEVGPAQFLQIRYEDLTRDPAAVLRVVCAFLGEEYDSVMLDDPSLRSGTVPAVASPWQARALTPVVPAGEGGWRQRLRRIDQVRVNAVVGSMLAPLGYQPPSARAKVLGLPLGVAETLRRTWARIRPARPPLTPEERYRVTRSFLESQAKKLEGDARNAS